MFDLRRARAGKLSVRSLIAVAGVAAAIFGMAQATGTMANPTDAVSTTVSQLSTGNLYPTPPVKSLGCRTTFVSSQNQARVEWTKPDDAGPYTYKWEIYKNDKTTLVASDVTTDLFKENRANSLPSNDWFYLRVKTINGAAQSSGWQGVEIKRISSVQATCGGGARWDQNNAGWENVSTWDPATPDPNGSAARGIAPQAMEMEPLDVDEETKAGETTTQDSTSTTKAPDSTTAEAPTSSTTTPATTTPATTTPETTPTEITPTEDPKLVLTDTVESGGLTAGWTAGGNKVAVVDADGKELASGRVEAGSALHWNNGQLWIVGATEVYRIMESPQDGKWKFYTDSGQNMPDFG